MCLIGAEISQNPGDWLQKAERFLPEKEDSVHGSLGTLRERSEFL
jgi:hypothetical protein